MKAPPGLSNPSGKVCLLQKSLYGLKQASRQWFAKLTSELISQGYTQSKNDYSLFLKTVGSFITIVAVYVDDILITGNDSQGISQLKSHLDHIFTIKDLGKLHFFLGIEVGYTNSGISLTQTKFTRKLLSHCKIQDLKLAVTPLPQNLKLHQMEDALYHDPTYHRTMVGKMNFLTHTRPDLAFTVQHLSQFLQEPREPHVAALHHALRYIAATVGQGILLNSSGQLILQAFSDSDWAACPNTRRSVTGYVLMLGCSPITWKSKKQSTVSKSSSEAEYRAMYSAASEVAWMVRLLQELQVPTIKPVVLHCDNMSAIHIARKPIYHERTKHIEIDCHFTREKVLEGLIQLTYLPTSSQLADLVSLFFLMAFAWIKHPTEAKIIGYFYVVQIIKQFHLALPWNSQIESSLHHLFEDNSPSQDTLEMNL
ncbi:uncharacterized mitochondrial protein AtMg00810-like [Amaranthus tricolor]|uniref:uncharacterized mitochondrial protein AtMg00810-like n=1 Tax=Amaranthus tricolor TaxID=29722 RepID=UPI0025837490|nr:uncharacterized mitochondrial protein AtMg00810-like [Amaranthus tricolor]